MIHLVLQCDQCGKTRIVGASIDTHTDEGVEKMTQHFTKFEDEHEACSTKEKS